MTRFVHLKNDCNDMLINTRGIVGVSNLDEETVTVELFDGTTHRVDRSHLPEITGDEAIMQIIPTCIYALYGADYEIRESRKVNYMAVTASGQLRPLDSCFNFVDVQNEHGYEFMGFDTKELRTTRR